MISAMPSSRKVTGFLAATATLLACTVPLCLAAPVSTEAERLAKQIDSLDVENHWPAGEHVKWETGIPDGKPEKTPGKHTHCSAFVAAAAKNVGI